MLKNQFLYTNEYCDAIQYEGLVFAATTRGTVFAWNHYDFGTFLPPLMALFLHGILVVLVCLSSTVNIIVSSICMRVSKFPFTN